MPRLLIALVCLSLLLSAAIFGFFYAWVCSTMWGLDAADPRVAIAAMQAMNGSVRNAVFAPAFFGTPIVLLLTAGLMWRQHCQSAAVWFALSALTYFGFGLVLTMTINVPMNETFALIDIPTDIDAARRIWQEYSAPWQFWNQARTVASGLSFLIAVGGTFQFCKAQYQSV